MQYLAIILLDRWLKTKNTNGLCLVLSKALILNWKKNIFPINTFLCFLLFVPHSVFKTRVKKSIVSFHFVITHWTPYRIGISYARALFNIFSSRCITERESCSTGVVPQRTSVQSCSESTWSVYSTYVQKCRGYSGKSLVLKYRTGSYTCQLTYQAINYYDLPQPVKKDIKRIFLLCTPIVS